jgi:hypothetical protein
MTPKEREFRKELAVAQGYDPGDFIGNWADQFAWRMPTGFHPGTDPYKDRREVARRLITEMLAALQVR